MKNISNFEDGDSKNLLRAVGRFEIVKHTHCGVGRAKKIRGEFWVIQAGIRAGLELAKMNFSVVW